MVGRSPLLTLARLLSAAGLVLGGDAMAQSGRPMFVAPGVTFPTSGAVVRAGQNGLIIEEGVASVDESDQYSLLDLSVDDVDGVVRFTYGDAWTLGQARPSSCVFTVRRVERVLTQDAANTLAVTLSAIELQRLKEAHPELTALGDQQVTGSVVRQVADRFTWTETVPSGPDTPTETSPDTAPEEETGLGTGTEADPAPALPTVFGLSKTWIFVLSARAWYVNKTCFVWTTAEDLTVIDQLIGLDYHRDPVA